MLDAVCLSGELAVTVVAVATLELNLCVDDVVVFGFPLAWACGRLIGWNFRDACDSSELDCLQGITAGDVTLPSFFFCASFSSSSFLVSYRTGAPAIVAPWASFSGCNRLAYRERPPFFGGAAIADLETTVWYVSVNASRLPKHSAAVSGLSGRTSCW